MTMTTAEIIWYFVLAVGVIALGGGLLVWWLGKTRKVGSRMGFRTLTTISNPEVWEYANKLYGELFMGIGIIVILLSLILNGLFLNSEQAASYFAMAVALAVLVAVELSIVFSARKAREIRRKGGGRGGGSLFQEALLAPHVPKARSSEGLYLLVRSDEILM